MSNDKVQPINEEQVSEGENFVELQGMYEHIPELFCTNKKNYVEKEIDSDLKSIHKEEIMVDADEADVILELIQTRKFSVSYKEQNKYLQDLNENLMLVNKILQEDLEEKEAYYQKLVSISKEMLKKKRALQE